MPAGRPTYAQRLLNLRRAENIAASDGDEHVPSTKAQEITVATNVSLKQLRRLHRHIRNYVELVEARSRGEVIDEREFAKAYRHVIKHPLFNVIGVTLIENTPSRFSGEHV